MGKGRLRSRLILNMQGQAKNALTCMTCQVVFTTAEQQREHYRSDWHTYNLKRKVAEFNPVTAEVFRTKVQAFKEKQQLEAKSEVATFVCTSCRKNFSTQNAHNNHLNSKRHKEQSERRRQSEGDDVSTDAQTSVTESATEVVESGSESDWEDAAEEEDAIPVGTCLFCNCAKPDAQSILKHMYVEHGFFIPDVEFCVDMDGLLTYLGQKVGCGCICLFCNVRSKTFHSVDAVQKHMRDKCHCKMAHEGEAMLEYADFYDYSLSYPEEADGENDKDVEPTEGILEVDADWQLVLPTGTTVGHRALNRYYKQRLKPSSELALTNVQKGRDSVQAVLAQYRSLGWTGVVDKKAAERKAKDLRFIKKMTAKSRLRLGVKANKLQRYFKRDDIML